MISLDRIRQFTSIFFIAMFAILCTVGVNNSIQCSRDNGNVSEVITKVDTLYLYDTVRIDKPIPIIIRDIDTILVQVKDTIHIQDTIYIKLPREQKTYQNKHYAAWISGYRPQLDSIHIYSNTRQIITSTTINTKQKRSRWGLGVHAGYGFTIQNNTIKAAPNISVGLNYNLLLF